MYKQEEACNVKTVEEINAEEIIKKSINYMLNKLPEDKLWRVLSYIQKIFEKQKAVFQRPFFNVSISFSNCFFHIDHHSSGMAARDAITET